MALAIGLARAVGATASDSSTTAAGNTTAGSIIIAMTASVGAGATFADSLLNTWSPLGTDLALTGSPRYANTLSVWKNEGGSRGNGHTFTGSNTGNFPSTLIVEITGTSVTVSVDGGTNADIATPYTSNPITTLASSEVVLVCWTDDRNANQALTQGNSFTTQAEVTDPSQFQPGGITVLGPTGIGTYNASITDTGATAINSTRLYAVSVKEGAGTVQLVYFAAHL